MKFPTAEVIRAVKHSLGREQTAQSQGNRLRTSWTGSEISKKKQEKKKKNGYVY
jgi:hypothetical protein